MKKILISITLLVISTTSCTMINLENEAKIGINFINKTNIIPKINVLKIGRKIANNEEVYKGNSRTEYSTFEYKNTKFEVFKPKHKNNDKVIYWVHGGAYYYPLSNVYRTMATYMLDVNDEYDIVFVNYGLIPKSIYPEANIDVENGLEYLKTKYKNIVMLGDSAGGNLVLSTLLKRKDEKKELVDAIILYSPFLDITFSVDSRIRNKGKDILIGNPYDENYEFEKLLVDNDYYKNVKDKAHPYISPLNGDFSGFPPVYIEVGKEEVLYDDSLILANKLKVVEMVSISGLFHDFQIIVQFRTSRDTVDRVYEFLKKNNN
ncbi:alpha/beta hydrolase [Oceanivirga salmonicida]|uniref:alpha/beta hydrolase n=1 Tax=Oceanivirga salmonicida TaxID=1769291 RepID=UPI000831A126|nr:alpha/beta hydrolase [Oceanivirga salmonicida]